MILSRFRIDAMRGTEPRRAAFKISGLSPLLEFSRRRKTHSATGLPAEELTESSSFSRDGY